MNKTPVVGSQQSAAPVTDKVCPLLGAITVGNALKPTLGQQSGVAVQPCIRDKCALWDGHHEQCSFITNNHNIEQLTDVVFKLIKKLSEVKIGG